MRNTPFFKGKRDFCQRDRTHCPFKVHLHAARLHHYTHLCFNTSVRISTVSREIRGSFDQFQDIVDKTPILLPTMDCLPILEMGNHL